VFFKVFNEVPFGSRLVLEANKVKGKLSEPAEELKKEGTRLIR
jgi:hypothetical protein